MSTRRAPRVMPELSATERVYFHPHLFAREKSLVDATPVLNTDKKYDASELAGAMLQVALLDAERRGVVALEVAKASRLFGLRKVDALFVRKGAGGPDAPGGTLDWRVGQLVAGRDAPMEAEHLLVDLLEEDASDPYGWTVALVARNMAKRGLLVSREARTLKVFRNVVYEMTEPTKALAAASRADDLRELLDRTRRERPEVWRLLEKAVKAAATRRKESDDDGPDFD